MARWVSRHLFNNAGIKLLALALALFLYLHVFASQENEILIDVPLDLHGIPEGLTWSGNLPATAEVRFRGLGLDLLKMRARLEQARLRVEVGEARPGHYQRPLVSEDVILPRDLRVQAVAVESPREISLEFDRLLVCRLGVVPRVGGRVAPGYTVHGPTVVEPDTVLVRGPEAVLESFEYLKTEVLDISGCEDMVTRRVPLVLHEGCQAIPPEVTVRVTIEPVISRTFAGLPIEVLRSRGVEVVRIEPADGIVSVSGPASVLESLSAEDLRVSIEARGLPPGGTYTLMASVELRRAAVVGAISIEPVRPEKFEVELK
ncbi:MAG: hypothetical protein KAY32_09065 [Candidatus Eisenbacteria sp.]|nr:hypothetical protein [Candidatus Eisenbacteria bacterium]